MPLIPVPLFDGSRTPQNERERTGTNGTNGITPPNGLAVAALLERGFRWSMHTYQNAFNQKRGLDGTLWPPTVATPMRGPC